MNDLIEQLMNADDGYTRRAVPLVYADHIEFLQSGRYPYNAEVVKFIAERHALAIPPNGRYDDAALAEFGDPLLLKLKHEQYLASRDARFDELCEDEAADIAKGYVGITSIEPHEGMKLYYGGFVYRLKAAPHDDWVMLKPKKRTTGISFNGLRDRHRAFENAKAVGYDTGSSIGRPIMVKVEE